ncbi:glutaminase A [Marinicauda salina]|uniref:Glutaminase n=1 Tax=Marinicauda salina TaxID=2135793 RepID=A0A2U2BWU8_9PROT|nr:glutaminase A [Marinicauda salina]PWE18460.1 glutaminase A [Marinicauda salina]
MSAERDDIAHSGAFSTRPAQFETEEAEAEECRGHAEAGFRELAAHGPVTGERVLAALEAAGLEPDDPRLSGSWEGFGDRAGEALDEDAFCDILPAHEASLVRRALTGRLASEDFGAFRRRIANLFYYSAEETSGRIADYIPELAKADPEAYAMGACTIDGQRFELGLREADAGRAFCVQSAMKPVNYAVAQELLGATMVHRHVGREPSGQSFNEITLDEHRRPHNPMINAGAIITTALIKPGASVDARFDFIRRVWRSASAGDACGFDQATYESELGHADRNFALAYFMREHGCFPDEADLHEALDLYFRCCAIETDVRRLAAVAATFANGGVCPVTERQVFQRETVKNTLSLMLSCGMYDFSGEYAFTVGLPAKSGVSGALMIVVPGVAGFALYSPRLGPKGNPQRGVEFSRRLVEAFPWHVYAPIVVDPGLG